MYFSTFVFFWMNINKWNLYSIRKMGFDFQIFGNWFKSKVHGSLPKFARISIPSSRKIATGKSWRLTKFWGKSAIPAMHHYFIYQKFKRFLPSNLSLQVAKNLGALLKQIPRPMESFTLNSPPELTNSM